MFASDRLTSHVARRAQREIQCQVRFYPASFLPSRPSHCLQRRLSCPQQPRKDRQVRPTVQHRSTASKTWSLSWPIGSAVQLGAQWGGMLMQTISKNGSLPTLMTTPMIHLDGSALLTALKFLHDIDFEQVVTTRRLNADQRHTRSEPLLCYGAFNRLRLTHHLSNTIIRQSSCRARIRTPNPAPIASSLANAHVRLSRLPCTGADRRAI